MHPEALILRRCYPVPVTFADMRASYDVRVPFALCGGEDGSKRLCWTAALKQVTGALDEVYAVVDGREVRVAVLRGSMGVFKATGPIWIGMGRAICDLAEVADEQGYWERPHEVRLDLSPRPVSHGEVARAVLVGQEYAERHGNR